MKSINVSVIMSEYNTNETYLRTSIKSILDQTYKDFEFIIIDDGGNNHLRKIVAEFDDTRVRIVKNSRNRGLIYSLNKAIREARGDYLVRMDTDDIALPNRIKTQYDFITAHPEYDVVGTKAMEFSGDDEFGILGKGGEKDKKAVMRGDSIIHPSTIIRKSAAKAAGCYKNYKRAEDLALWCEMLLRGSRLYVIDEVLLRYRVNPDDYKKRGLKSRAGEIKARLHYYPKMKANAVDYLRVVKSIFAGALPSGVVSAYRKRFVLQNNKPTKKGGKS